MDRDDRELGDLVQTQATEIDDLKIRLDDLGVDTDKNRSVTRERPVMSKRPLRTEGADSDHRFMEENGKTYYLMKVNGKWKKMEVTDV